MTSTPDPVAEPATVNAEDPSLATGDPGAVDERLIASHDLALSALREITPAASIGEPVGYVPEADGVVSLRFVTRLAGYPGWFWTVSVARVEDAEPTVLEVELLPGDGALLAPEWVPWAVRLADYHAAQAALAEAADAAGEDADDLDDEDDDEDLDELDSDEDDDLDVDGSPILHAGDLDGVDIDQFAEDDDDLDADDSDEDDDLADGDLSADEDDFDEDDDRDEDDRA